MERDIPEAERGEPQTADETEEELEPGRGWFLATGPDPGPGNSDGGGFD